MNAGKLARKRRHLSRSIALMFVGHVGSVQQNQRSPPIRWPNSQSEGAMRLPGDGPHRRRPAALMYKKVVQSLRGPRLILKGSANECGKACTEAIQGRRGD